uniref:NADH-ubiquinone oxidoreductase chain 5 n=2 Tax=Leptotrombidium pallidum TaxID=279272 RepID=Q4W8D4_9ACAR|nr:NADH dehydrogenase subunit 5 [Leptotrombidium pallidum]BAD99505.1 NADH dehydrogenase subunit 5 [Leptotrombidium pallidum]
MPLFLFLLHLILFFSGCLLKKNLILEISFSSFPISFCLDWVSLVFSSFVLLISCLVLIYSEYYMMGDLFMKRFKLILLLFVASMIVLIFSGSMFTMMIGWDGLGIVSFALVIYYSDKEALISGLITIFTNRIGDALMLISIFLMIGNWKYSSFQGSMFFMVGAMTKSAQLPFSAWLPAAMSAPTPISALVHSSTLVTAGIFVMLRFNQLLLFSSKLLTIMSLGTMLGGGMIALFEKDMKKIIAMSTLSQLGLMFFMLSIGAWKICFFHMVCHAIFKSMMFLSAGSFILDGDQNANKKGKLMNLQSLPSTVLIFSSFSLSGIPFFSGFFSKDLALDLIFSENMNLLTYILFLLGCVLTIFYSLRLIFPSIWKTSVQSEIFGSISLLMSLPLLMIWSAISGKILSNLLLMEEFNLISFPLKSVGLFIILLGSFFFFNSKLNLLKLPTISLSYLSSHFLSNMTIFSESDSKYIEETSKIGFSFPFFHTSKMMKMEKETFLIWLFPFFAWIFMALL